MNKDQGLDKNKNDYYIIQHKRRPNMQEETGFIQYSEMFIEKLRFNRASENTIKGYSWAVRKLQKEFGKTQEMFLIFNFILYIKLRKSFNHLYIIFIPPDNF